MPVLKKLFSCTLLFSIALLPAFTAKKESASGSFTDERDGKVYATIRIGEQTWMAENLNYETTGSWCGDCDVYGRMYNFEAALAACPPGWHLPSDKEWRTLINALGGEAIAGGKMKSDQLWNAPNKGATNSSGFNALPAHYRTVDGKIRDAGFKAAFWTSDKIEDPAAATWALYADKELIQNVGYYRSSGFSVRCVKD